MKAHSKKQQAGPSPFLKALENVLLVIVTGLMVFRATYIETPHIEQIQTPFYLTSEIVSLLLSSALLLCVALWLTVVLCTNQFRWRRTWMGAGVCLFLTAAGVALFAASNKRAAVTDAVLLITPMLSAMLLVQLFTSRAKAHLVLILVMAAALMMTVQCIDQLANSNEMMIQDYERDTAGHLANLNIEPDSLEHWMYEHRLYSEDIRGFLLTGNSAAAFFLLALFAALGLCIEAFRCRRRSETLPSLLCYGLVVLFALGGLAMTHSKGGTGAFVIGIGLLTGMGFFGPRLWRHRLSVGILIVLAIVVVTAGMIGYGVKHGRLPGGNSMLVRWQYWHSTAAMIADAAFTGVGGGNFQFVYPQYKAPAASETIQDPHNFVLSLLSQYGPLGLLGFLAAVLGPVYKNVRHQYEAPAVTAGPPQRFSKRLWLGLFAISMFLLLFVRPMLVDVSFLYQQPDVRAAAYVVLYLFPAGIFVLGFVLLGAVATGDYSMQQPRRFLSLALIGGMVAVLIHNLVDFAIFETGVWNIFWLLLAVLAAQVHNNAAHDATPAALSKPQRLAAIAVLLAVTGGCLAVAVVPPLAANRLFRRAMMVETPQVNLLDHAIAADPLAPNTAYNAAGMLMQTYNHQRPLAKDPALLEKASRYAAIAQRRNRHYFKPYRLQSDIALVRAAAVEDEDRQRHLQNAYDYLLAAARHYPGSGRIHFGLGQMAEQLNQPEKALNHYEQAVAIEEAYQAQFQIMYPDRDPVISRLGNRATTIAGARIKELRKALENAGENTEIPNK